MTDPRVTLVTSVKEQFSVWPLQLRALRETAPGVPIVVMRTGPMGAAIDAELQREAASNPDVRVVETGLDFGNSFELWNRALPLVTTPLVVFLFNDVLPANPAWLSELVAAADAHPEAAFFQPFLWEGEGRPHAAWTDLYFRRSAGRLALVHPFDRARAGVRDPSELQGGEQPFFLEDHAFLARTDFLRRESIFDPGCFYSKEYLDFALSIRYRGASIRSVPSSQAIFRAYDPIRPEDLIFYAYRRSEELCVGSAAHLRRKWGIQMHYDHIGRILVNRRMTGVSWSAAELPGDSGSQRNLTLAFFVLAGYNRFQGERLPDFYPRLRATPGDVALPLVMSRVTVPAAFPDFTPDYAGKAEALRGGGLFRIVDGPDAEAPSGADFQPFVMLELGGARGSEAGILEALAPYAGLIVREGEERYRAWIHVRINPGEVDAARALTGEARDPSVCGKAWKDAELSVRLSAPGLSAAAPLRLGSTSEGWKLIHWSWSPRRLNEWPLLLGT